MGNVGGKCGRGRCEVGGVERRRCGVVGEGGGVEWWEREEVWSGGRGRRCEWWERGGVVGEGRGRCGVVGM